MRKRFLFLDDTEERHEHFDRICEALSVDVWHVYTVKQAIDRLKSDDRFDCVFLDHDLDERDDWNGWVVAKFIAVHMDRGNQPRNVVIHSWNPAGADDMESVLLDSGYRNVRRVEFSFGG